MQVRFCFMHEVRRPSNIEPIYVRRILSANNVTCVHHGGSSSLPLQTARFISEIHEKAVKFLDESMLLLLDTMFLCPCICGQYLKICLTLSHLPILVLKPFPVPEKCLTCQEQPCERGRHPRQALEPASLVSPARVRSGQAGHVENTFC